MNSAMNTNSRSIESKNELRILAANMRNEIVSPVDIQAGARIIQHILSMPECSGPTSEGAVIGLYYPIRMEVNLISQIGLLRARGFRVALPRVNGDEIVFSIVQEGDALTNGVFGIREPQQKAPQTPIEELRAVCVPGLAFGLDGARLGYGKGFYDRSLRTLSEERRPVLLGIGYDFQKMDAIPQEAHDEIMDYIVTPSGAVKCSPYDSV